MYGGGFGANAAMPNPMRTPNANPMMNQMASPMMSPMVNPMMNPMLMYGMMGANFGMPNSMYFGMETRRAPISLKSRITAFVLCFFFGIFGFHRFYVRKTGTGILWLLTLGVFGLGSLIDILLIVSGYFRDKDGAFLRE